MCVTSSTEDTFLGVEGMFCRIVFILKGHFLFWSQMGIVLGFFLSESNVWLYSLLPSQIPTICSYRFSLKLFGWYWNIRHKPCLCIILLVPYLFVCTNTIFVFLFWFCFYPENFCQIDKYPWFGPLEHECMTCFENTKMLDWMAMICVVDLDGLVSDGEKRK